MRLFIGNVPFEVHPDEVLGMCREQGPVLEFQCVRAAALFSFPRRRARTLPLPLTSLSPSRTLQPAARPQRPRAALWRGLRRLPL